MPSARHIQAENAKTKFIISSAMMTHNGVLVTAPMVLLTYWLTEVNGRLPERVKARRVSSGLSRNQRVY
jgi:hypothetical protein